MRVSVFRAAMILGLGFSVPVCAQINDVGMFQQGVFGQKIIESNGEVLLTPNLNLEDGYLLAEKLAKSNAAKLFGEYYEVVREVDDATGEIKEVVVSVNAAIMKYEVVSRKAETIDGNIVLKVAIKATADKKDLNAALNRYYQNEQSKKDVVLMSEHVVALQNKLAEQTLVIERLMEDSKTSIAHNNNDKIDVLQKSFAKQFVDYDSKLASIKKALLYVDGDSVASDYMEGKIEDGRAKYINLLKQNYADTKVTFRQTTKPDYLEKNQVTDITVNFSGSKYYFNYLFKDMRLMVAHRGLSSPNYSGYVEVPGTYPSAEFVYDYNLDLVVTINGKDSTLPIIKSYYGRTGHIAKGVYFAQRFNERDNLRNVNVSFNHKRKINSFFDNMSVVSPLGQDISIYYRFILTEISSGKQFEIDVSGAGRN